MLPFPVTIKILIFTVSTYKHQNQRLVAHFARLNIHIGDEGRKEKIMAHYVYLPGFVDIYCDGVRRLEFFRRIRVSKPKG